MATVDSLVPHAVPASFVRCDETVAWAALQTHFDNGAVGFDLRQAFREDADRFTAFSQRAPHS